MLREVPIALSAVAPRDLAHALARALESLDPGAAGDPLDRLIRSLAEGLEACEEGADADAVLRALDALAAAPGTISGKVWADLPGDAIAALIEAHGGA